jgi:hypothetical protein
MKVRPDHWLARYLKKVSNMNRLFTVITFLFLLLTSCISVGTLPPSTTISTSINTPITGEISGKVIDSSDGSPIPFANVTTEPPTSSVTTDADGEYSISGVYPGNYSVIATKQDNTSGEVRVAVVAGQMTVADLHFVSGLAYFPTTTPRSVPTVTDVYAPILFGSNMLANGNLEENDFGLIANWAPTNIDLYRWYLVQDVPVSRENENARWVEQVELVQEGRGYGLKSVDFQKCNYFCSASAVQIVPAQENRVYTLSAEARREHGSGGTLYMDFLNANMGRIKPHTKGGYCEEWSQQEVTAMAPEGTRYIRVILYSSNNAQGIVYWDNVELRENE